MDDAPIDELRQKLIALRPVLSQVTRELLDEQASLEKRCRDAEFEAYSRDLSAQKGAEMRLEEHQELQGCVESFKQSLEELVTLLG